MDIEKGDNPEDHGWEDCLCRSYPSGFHGLHLEGVGGGLHFVREALFQCVLVKTYWSSPLARFVSPSVGEGCQISCSINSL